MTRPANLVGVLLFGRETKKQKTCGVRTCCAGPVFVMVCAGIASAGERVFCRQCPVPVVTVRVAGVSVFGLCALERL